MYTYLYMYTIDRTEVLHMNIVFYTCTPRKWHVQALYITCLQMYKAFNNKSQKFKSVLPIDCSKTLYKQLTTLQTASQ